jgi:hypothetical protein
MQIEEDVYVWFSLGVGTNINYRQYDPETKYSKVRKIGFCLGVVNDCVFPKEIESSSFALYLEGRVFVFCETGFLRKEQWLSVYSGAGIEIHSSGRLFSCNLGSHLFLYFFVSTSDPIEQLLDHLGVS